MLALSAGKFLLFASATRTAKTRMVTNAVQTGSWPSYQVPPDYWVKLRWGLARMIRTNDFSGAAQARLLSSVPADRRQHAGVSLAAFVAGWPGNGATYASGTRLTCTLGNVTIRCLPHTVVDIGGRLVFARFVFSSTGLLNSSSKAHFELLRLSAQGRGVPGAILIPSGAVVFPRRDNNAQQFLRAEARELARLWRLNGGS